jgi:hypothetical protein
MPQFRLARKGTLQELQEVPLQDWLEAATTAEQYDWFEGIGELDSTQKVETLQALSRIVLKASVNNTEVGGDSRFFEFARRLESFLSNWKIIPDLSGPSTLVFQNEKGVCFEANLVLGDTVQFQPRLSEIQRMAVRSGFRFPKMQANITKSVDSIYAGLKMGFLRDMELLSTLILMWEKKSVKTR